MANWFIDLDWGLIGDWHEDFDFDVVEFSTTWRTFIGHDSTCKANNCTNLQATEFLNFVFVLNQVLCNAAAVLLAQMSGAKVLNIDADLSEVETDDGE